MAVKPTSKQIMRRNRELKAEFERRGLELDGVWSPSPDDPELENRQLLALMDWVRAYQALADRREMEKRGYLYPPVDPDCDPDTDWLQKGGNGDGVRGHRAGCHHAYRLLLVLSGVFPASVVQDRQRVVLDRGRGGGPPRRAGVICAW